MATISAILQDIALDHHSTINASSSSSSSPKTHHDFLSSPVRAKIRKKKSTREKIESMVTEGSKNYPAYLKLIYTGESDFSSEDESVGIKPKGKINDNKRQIRRDNSFGEIELENGEIQSPTEKMVQDAKEAEKSSEDNDPLPPLQLKREKPKSRFTSLMRKSKSEDSFYDTIETSSPVEYDNAANTAQGVIQDPTERARQEEEWKTELAKLEEEIMTLRTVLSAKQYQASEIKRKLGITPMAEFRSDLKSGIQNIKGSDAYRKTNEGFTNLNTKITNSAAVQKTNEKLTQITESIQSSDTYQKTNTAFKSLGAWSSKKMGDMRNSNAFKSFEERVGGAYTTVKTKVSGSKSENNFAEAVDQSEAPTSVENPIGNTEVEKPL